MKINRGTINHLKKKYKKTIKESESESEFEDEEEESDLENNKIIEKREKIKAP